ncbi:putative reverse transcriptase domain-containing protein [Tanacetum coccineum]
METSAKTESLILKRLNDGHKFMKGLDSDVRDEVQYIHKLDQSVVTLEDHVISLEEEIEKLREKLKSTEVNNSSLRVDRDRAERDLYHVRVWVRACYGDEIPQWTDEGRPKEATDVVTTLGDTQPSELIMSPRRMSQAAIERLVTDKVAEAIAVDHATRNTASRQGGNTGEAWGQARAPTKWFSGIRKCAKGKKVKFSTATLQGRALTWWNSQVATLGLERANQTSWTKIKKLMAEECCPREEIQRMEHELWNLKVNDYNITAYTHRFNELALMCPRMVEPKSVKVEAYIRGLFENINGEVTSSKPANLNEAVRMAHTLMEQKVQARTEIIAEENKRK